MPVDPRAPHISVLVALGADSGDLLALHRALAAELQKLAQPLEFLYLVPSHAGAQLPQALALHEHEDPAHVRVLCFAQPLGEAALLRAGFEAARGQILLTLPGYFEVEPADLPLLYEAVRDGADLALGSRAQWSQPQWLQSRLFNRIVAKATGAQFADVASRTRALRREVLEEVHVYGDFDRYLPVLAHRMGFAVREIPVRQHPHTRPPLLHSPGTYLWRGLDVLSIFFLSRFTRHPLRLFGGLGTGFGLLGALILFVVTVQKFAGQALSDRPILILGTLLLGLGVQLFTIGLLGELIVFFHARTIRDYRIAAIYESDPAPLPERTDAPGSSSRSPAGTRPGHAPRP
jgi:glycosyltransferase involved in cell wall biosynthesis